MAQVVTNENMLEFIEKGSVAEFKAPEPTKAAEPSKTEAKVEPTEGKTEQPRDEGGKFVKAEEGKKGDEKQAAKTAAEDEGNDPEDADLPERVRRQIGKKHRAMKEAEEFAADSYRARLAAEERAEALERELAGLRTKSGPKPEKDANAPKPEDFKTVAEYADALTDYLLEKKLAAREQQQVKSRQDQEQDQTRQVFAERVSKAATEIPDYYEVVEAADVEVPAHIAQYITQSDLGPQIGYHLAKHEDVFNRIKKLSPIRAIAELGKLEASLEKPPQKQPEKEPAAAPREVSRAPAPISTLDGKSTPVEKDPAKMSFRELREYERQREAARRSAR